MNCSLYFAHFAFVGRVSRVVLGGAIAVGMAGCMSMQSGSTLDQITGVLTSREPFVEAYFEYPGPNERWAGPRSFILHVEAKDADTAKVEILPKTAEVPAELSKARAPAAVGAVPLVKLPRDVARDLIAHFATSLNENDVAHVGCVHPVRVRLTKSNGALIEKQGCRGVGQWTRNASELVAYFVTTERYGYTERKDVAKSVVAEATGAAKETGNELSNASARVPASVSGAAQDERTESPAQKNLKVEIERVPTGTQALGGAREIASQPEASEHGAHGETKSPTH